MPRKDDYYIEDYSEAERMPQGEIWQYMDYVGLRNIYFFGPVTRPNILKVIARIHILETMDPEKDIHLYINSDGGFIVDCLSLIDTMDNSPCDIATHVYGMAASAACLIASSGTKGKRYGSKNSEFMYHEAIMDFPNARPSLMKEYSSEAKRIEKKCNNIFKKNTERTLAEIRELFLDTRVDKFVTSKKAREFGIIDHVEGKKRIVKISHADLQSGSDSDAE